MPTYTLGYQAANRFDIAADRKCSPMQTQNAIPNEDIGKEREIICGETTLSKDIVLNHVISLVLFFRLLKFKSSIWVLMNPFT